MEESSDNSESAESNADVASLEGRIRENLPEKESSDNENSEHEAGRVIEAKNYFKREHIKPQYKNLKSAYSKSSSESTQIERTNDGAVALIYHKDEATGKVEFLFEQRPADDSEAGKMSLPGGAIDIVDGRREGSLETLMRELDEEISDVSCKAKSIIRDTLNATRDLYTVVADNVGGETALTYVYKIEIQSAKEWEIVKRAYFANDAGNARVLSSDDLETFTKRDFAFSFGETVLGFVFDNQNRTMRFDPISAGYQSKVAALKLLAAENYKFVTNSIPKPISTFSTKPVTYSMQYKIAA